MDAAAKNIGMYKSGFKQTKKMHVQHTPFNFQDALSPEHLKSLGLERRSYPTPKSNRK